MSFATDINHLMTNDTSLNNLVEGGIHYENLPDNFDLSYNWIVYSFNKAFQVSCLGSSAAVTQYNITVKIISTDTVELEVINDYLVNYLNGKSYNNIEDIVFTNDNHTIDMEKGVYVNQLQFDALYS